MNNDHEYCYHINKRKILSDFWTSTCFVNIFFHYSAGFIFPSRSGNCSFILIILFFVPFDDHLKGYWNGLSFLYAGKIIYPNTEASVKSGIVTHAVQKPPNIGVHFENAK